MKRLKSLLLLVTLAFTYACHHPTEVANEPWMDKPIKEWPTIVLRNRIQLQDSTLNDFANAFLIINGKDTLGITCKHVFLVLKKFGIDHIKMNPDIKNWELYSDKGSIRVELLPSNTNELIGDFNTLKSRDWIILLPLEPIKNVQPLNIRWKPIKKGESVYAISRHFGQKINSAPEIRHFACYKNVGPYYYMHAVGEHPNPVGCSGSPVVDANGYLVGIISGQEGQLTVIASLQYLKSLLNKPQ